MSALWDRVRSPPLNVGGGDLVMRVVACVLISAVSVLAVPQLAVPWSLLKIGLLSAAELGLLCLMLGMFLRARTYFAGLQLFATPLLMLALVQGRFAWGAVALGLLSLAVGVSEIVSRRCRLNALLGISSYRAQTTSILETALQPEAPPRPPTVTP